MQLSIHYYVLSLSAQTSRLFEGFRDTLIAIHNARFPFANSYALDESTAPRYSTEQLRDFFKKSDEHLAHYFNQDPLRVILVGEAGTPLAFRVPDGTRGCADWQFIGCIYVCVVPPFGQHHMANYKEGACRHQRPGYA